MCFVVIVLENQGELGFRVGIGGKLGCIGLGSITKVILCSSTSLLNFDEETMED
jgi:hypothetical protein